MGRKTTTARKQKKASAFTSSGETERVLAQRQSREREERRRVRGIFRKSRDFYYADSRERQRSQRPPTGNVIQIVAVLWTSFCWSDATRAMISSVCSGIKWGSLRPNDMVLFMNSALTRACLMRMTRKGRPVGVHFDLVGKVQESMIDVRKAIGRDLLGVPRMRRKDLVDHLDRSRVDQASILSRARAEFGEDLAA